MSLTVLAALLLLAFVILTANPPGYSTALPNPNGYDDFIRAGAIVQDDLSANPVMTHDTLASVVATNSEALAAARLGLSRKCSAHTDQLITNNMTPSDLIGMKRLAQLFATEGRLAEMDGRFADAARSYADAIRLGNESSRGGLVIHRLVGIACEAIGMMPLAKLVPKLDCEQARPIISELAKIDSEGVAWGDIWRDERRYARWQIRQYHNPVRLVTDMWHAHKIKGPVLARHNKAVAHLRLIMVELALRCYRSDQGQPPSSLNELVPKYLQTLPYDPFASGPLPLMYRSNGTNWVLYSVGVDRKDDGGQPATSRGNSAKGDLFYDSPW